MHHTAYLPFPVSTCGHESRSIPPAWASGRLCPPGWLLCRSVDRPWAKGSLFSCWVTMGNASSGDFPRLICWHFCVYTLHRAACPVCFYLLQKCPLLAVLCLTLTLTLQWACKRKLTPFLLYLRVLSKDSTQHRHGLSVPPPGSILFDMGWRDAMCP